jgi:hypothetical protein
MKISLYAKSNLFKVEDIEEYLKEKIRNHDIEFCGDFIKKYPDRLEEISHQMASIRVLNPMSKFQYNEPTYGEIRFERRVLLRQQAPHGVLYDGYKLQEIYRSMIPRERRTLDHIHIIFTDRFFGTYDNSDLRYHGRVIILGYPSVISTTGIVEAPAKPRDFYLKRRLVGEDPLAYEELKRQYKGRFIDYGDPRLGEVLKGYTMQAIFYHIYREAFCENKKCRLYNAHWQEEVIEAQLSKPEFCRRHAEMAKSL